MGRPTVLRGGRRYSRIGTLQGSLDRFDGSLISSVGVQRYLLGVGVGVEVLEREALV